MGQEFCYTVPCSVKYCNHQNNLQNDPPFTFNRCQPNIYTTTSKTDHNIKPMHTVLSNDVYKKAPGHWMVNYNQNIFQKNKSKSECKKLSIDNCVSEMKSQFTGSPEVRLSTTFSYNLRPPTFEHHLTNGPLKTLVPSTQNPYLSGNSFFVQDKGVLSYHSDPYMTTSQKDFRTFSRDEKMNGVAKSFSKKLTCKIDQNKSVNSSSYLGPFQI